MPAFVGILFPAISKSDVNSEYLWIRLFKKWMHVQMFFNSCSNQLGLGIVFLKTSLYNLWSPESHTASSLTMRFFTPFISPAPLTPPSWHKGRSTRLWIPSELAFFATGILSVSWGVPIAKCSIGVLSTLVEFHLAEPSVSTVCLDLPHRLTQVQMGEWEERCSPAHPSLPHFFL